MNYQADHEGYYGQFGGAYVPEILHKCVEDLQKAYLPIIESDDFQEEYRALLRDEFGLEYAQLHGAEPPELCERLRRAGLRVIKAFGIGPAGDGLPAADSGYAEACDLYLFDTCSAGYGGSGRAFEWEALRHYSERVPFFLSGGVGPDSVVSIEHIENDMFVGVDLNSRFELSPGVKDVASLAAFIESLTYRNTLDNK